jgi:hypothetical protein
VLMDTYSPLWQGDTIGALSPIRRKQEPTAAELADSLLIMTAAQERVYLSGVNICIRLLALSATKKPPSIPMQICAG